MKKKLLFGLALALSALGFFLYEQFTSPLRSTENAYLNADVTEIAAQVGGRVTAVHVRENQWVKRGDPLFDLDDAPFRIALERAEANLAQAMQNARENGADAALARAQIAQNETDLANARSTLKRAQELVAQRFQSQQAVDDARARVESLEAATTQSRAKLSRALAAPADVRQRADVLKAQAEIGQARLDLEHTRISAMQDGMVSNLSLTPGAMVATGAPLFALIAQGSFHLDANFKETELAGIRPGLKADIKVDMYPDHPFSGTVESISGGTGTAFSLLPPQNATGNWVKIAQRVPVRIKLEAPDPAYPLRIGATATVTVHLR